MKLSGKQGNKNLIVNDKKKLFTNSAIEKNGDKMIVHVLLDVTIPENSFKCITAYAKLPPGEYLIIKGHLESQLYTTDALIQIRSFEVRSFPIAVVDVNDTEIITKEGTQVTSTEGCEGI